MTNARDVIVVGSANQDYIVRVPRVPEQGETIMASGLRKIPGGKGANQAVAAARLGSVVRFVGCVGDDDDGALLLRELRAEGVDTTDVDIVGSEPTGLALVSVDAAGDNAIVVVPGANFALSGSRVMRALQRQEPDGLVVLQGEVRPAVLAAGIEAAAARGLRAVVNLAPFTPLEPEVLALCDPLVVNESEAASMLGERVEVDEADDAVRRLAGMCRSAVITLGAAGAVWAAGEQAGHVPAHAPESVVDTTGAGDAFVGAMVARLAGGAGLGAGVEYGVRAGTFAVTHEGAQSSYPMAHDLPLDHESEEATGHARPAHR